MKESTVSKAFRYLTYGIAFVTGSFHMLNIGGLIIISTQWVRIFHLMMMLSLTYLTFIRGKENKQAHWIWYALSIIGVIASFTLGVYLLSSWKEIALSGGVTTKTDSIVGIIMILVIVEATRRSLGNMLTLILVFFLAYPFVGRFLPGILRARFYSLQSVSSFLFASGQGIYGIPVGVSATYIILFTIYGAFLSEFNVGNFLYDLANSLTRNLKAAAAKTAVIFSAFVGLISGSAAGNVAVSGTFTIPIMKRDGYKDYEAGAIEAVASTGGQIAPPVMGAAAFIMAEIIGRPYLDIVRAGIIPALLFFTSIFFVVHYESIKTGTGLKRSMYADVKPLGELLKKGWYNLVPIISLIVILVRGYSPFKSAFYSILILLGIFFIEAIVKRQLSWEFLLRIYRAIRDGTQRVVPIAIACAAAGIISGILSMTGLGSKLSAVIIHLSLGISFIALIFTMITSIILGMGLPTTAAYLILATVIAPALSKMGIPVLSAHMFVFFFGCISTITPPVALASYVAAGLAQADVKKVSFTAFRFALTSYIIPFLFAYTPALLLTKGTGVLRSILEIGTAFLAVLPFAIGIVGSFKVRIPLWKRAIFIASGVLLGLHGIITDAIGLGVLLMLLVDVQFKRKAIHGNKN
jgi:TRAP transporter 4TM/12TM fusion protein